MATWEKWVGLAGVCALLAGCPRFVSPDGGGTGHDGGGFDDAPTMPAPGTTGAPCTAPSDCHSGLCENARCTAGCMTAGDCPTGWTCGGDHVCQCTSSGTEACDGLDNNCDGIVDNNAICPTGTHCSSGSCIACPADHLCNGLCVDTQSDPNNCGACGVACGANSACSAGHCGMVMPPTPVDRIDLLVEVDNSNSMRENQQNLMSQLGPLVGLLTNPPCTSSANPTPHACDPSNTGDRPVHPPVRDLHVGVISSDLGTPGSSVPGCANSDSGDDGLLNPIRYGQALARHEPLPGAPSAAPAGFRPDDCTRADQFPSFISFVSGTTDPTAFAHDFRCNAGLFVNGCGLEQQLESAWRALIWHDATDREGNTDPNAGFVRGDALLAILLLTDEEDGSVRDCRYGGGMPCNDALDVFNASSTSWSSANLNLRDYMYSPGSPQDPTWPLDRYVDPRNAAAGFLSLKPGHPERVVFAAITGVPLNIPTRADGSQDWDALLGAPDAANHDNFVGRNSSTAITAMSAEGPISMRQANPDPSCPDRTVPACRREGSMYNPSGCTTTDQYFAWPARRIVEVARRFDESPLCGGRACHNGVVASICSSNYSSAIDVIVSHLSTRLIE